MKLFCRESTHLVCSNCKVHFQSEPVKYAKHQGYCRTCRKPLDELEARKQLVLYWAELRWEQLEAQAIAETKTRENNLAHAMSEQQATMAKKMANKYGGTFGLFGGMIP